MASAAIASRRQRSHGLRAPGFVLALGLLSFGAVTVAANAPSELETDTLPAFTALDTLFLTAATGEPRLQAMRDSCERKLLALDAVTVSYLLARRLSDQTPRQRRYVERLFGLLADSGRHAGPGRALGLAVETANDSVKAQLLYVASTMADSSLQPLGLRYIGHAKPEIRRMAARVLGMVPRAEASLPLWQGLAGASETERHQRLWALAAIAPYPGCDSLRAFLGDSSLAVRQMAIHALGRCAAGDIAKLRLPDPQTIRDENPEGKSWSIWLALALQLKNAQGKSYAEKACRRLTAPAQLFHAENCIMGK